MSVSAIFTNLNTLPRCGSTHRAICVQSCQVPQLSSEKGMFALSHRTGFLASFIDSSSFAIDSGSELDSTSFAVDSSCERPPQKPTVAKMPAADKSHGKLAKADFGRTAPVRPRISSSGQGKRGDVSPNSQPV